MEFPSGFRGLIKIPQSASGVNITESNGEYVVVIPESGLVELRDRSPFYHFHELRQPFKRGDSAGIAQDEVAYFSLWS